MPMPGHQTAYSVRHFLLQGFLIFVLLGCTASLPRFRLGGISDEPRQTTADSGTTLRRSEVLEELAENDKPVDIPSVLHSLDTVSSPSPALDKHKALDEILASIGTPYSFSGTDSTGIDCSGFTSKIYSSALGKLLPHSTADQYAISRPVDDEQRKFGDLLFFGTAGDAPSHVAIYLGEALFAHASVSGGVTISSLESSYYKRHYLGARRVVE